LAITIIDYHPEVENDLNNAFIWNQSLNFSAAIEFQDTINQALKEIVENPLLWPVEMGNIRKKVIKKFPYIIFYEIINEQIYVFVIAAARKKPGYWLNRLEK